MARHWKRSDWWLQWRRGINRRHAIRDGRFRELGVAVPGTGRARWGRGRRYGTTWSDPEWNRTYRDREAIEREYDAEGYAGSKYLGIDPDSPWTDDYSTDWQGRP